MQMQSIPLTQTTLDEKRAELERLTQLRKEVIQRLATAREMGDLSENGAYHAAKFELGNVGRQLRDVNFLLANGYVPESADGSVVAFGQSVTLASDGRRVVYMIVSQYESDPVKRKLSMESPIGAAILGKRVGDTVRVETPKGMVEYEVVSLGDTL